MKLITKHHKCIGKHKRLWIKRGARSMRKNVKKFIFIIIILNCLLMFNNSYGVTYKKELSIDIAYKEWTMITRYIVASQNATIRRLSPEWYNLTSEQIKELDKNNNGKIDNNDLRIIKRHIEAMNNADVRKQHPDWIIYCEEYEVKNITLSETSGTLNIGDSRTIIATTGPTKVNNDEIVWQSNNTKVATVENGKITAISSGSAIITAKYKKDENIRAEYKLNVVANVTKIALSETSGTLKEGESKTLTATTAPTKVNNNEIIWQSSNTKVATVENGKIIAVSAGTTTITAKTSNGKTATATVTVTSSTTQNTPPAKKPTSASQLKLYKTSSGNSNPRYLKSPVTGKTEKVQSFAITDLGTSKETIWYAFQTYNNNKYKQTLINAYRDNNRVYSVALNYGGEGQGVDIDKIGDNTYSIYCQRNE